MKPPITTIMLLALMTTAFTPAILKAWLFRCLHKQRLDAKRVTRLRLQHWAIK